MNVIGSCQQILIDEITRRGPLSFARFVELCLYHPTYGYYMRDQSRIAGHGGDFYTSPETSSVFGEVLAEVFASLWKTLGTERFMLVELGAGNGRLAVDVLAAMSAKGLEKGLNYKLLEKNPRRLDEALRRLSRFPRVSGTTQWEDLEDEPIYDGCVFSNEFFDALPFHRLVKEGEKWKEVGVDWTGSQFQEVLMDLTCFLPPHLHPLPQKLICRPDIDSMMQACSQFIARGYVLTIDYGSGFLDYWDPQRSGEQWGCFARHRFDKDPYIDVGEKDITADVDFTSLARAGLTGGLEPLYFNTQANFLLSAGKKIWEKHAVIARSASDEAISEIASPSARNDVKSQKAGMRWRLAAQHLLHPSGMGEAFQVLLQSKQAPMPQILVGEPNRLKRLIELTRNKLFN